MTVRRARYGKIERLTESLLERAGIDAPSVDVRMLLAREGIEVRAGDLGGVSGVLARKCGLAIIGVNNRQAPVRQRFTMAHEYGHYFLHEGLSEHLDEGFRLTYRDQESATAAHIEEIEANFFAACLLMPKRFLEDLNAKDLLDDDTGVRRLAKLFEVSQHAMSLRLANVYARYSPF